VNQVRGNEREDIAATTPDATTRFRDLTVGWSAFGRSSFAAAESGAISVAVVGHRLTGRPLQPSDTRAVARSQSRWVANLREVLTDEKLVHRARNAFRQLIGGSVKLQPSGGIKRYLNTRNGQIMDW
jgi:hypothetical protein